jgi:lysozyme
MPITCLEDQLRRDEEERQFAYDDATGKTLLKGQTLQGNLTIGVGHNLSALGISQKVRDFILADDKAIATAALEANFPWTMDLDDARKGALLNMAFNMGIRGLAEFKDFLVKMQAKEFLPAAGSMLDSIWAKQVGDRATRLSIQIESGFWQ